MTTNNPLVQVVEDAVAVESSVDTSALTYAGVCVWPIVRRILHFTRLSKDPQQPKSLEDIQADPALATELSLPDDRMDRDGIAREQASMVAGETAPDFLFLSRLMDHSDTVNGLKFNRLVDPYLWHLRRQYKCLKLEIVEDQPVGLQERFEPTAPYALPDWRSSPVLAGLPSDLYGFEPVQKALTQQRGRPFSLDLLANYLPRLFVRHDQFIEMLKVLQPKAVFVICYYSADMLALCWACRDLGIPVVDIQHGQQGPYHLMYNHWTAAPTEGYHLLPDAFFTWGKPTQTAQITGLPEGRLRPFSHVAGHPWIGLWQDNGPLKMGNALTLSLAPLKRDKVVLCALQPTDELLPRVLVQAMADNPDTMFLLRLHPQQHHRLDQLEGFLAGRGLSNWNVRQATMAPLYPLIQFSDHVMTMFSSVAWEAVAFDRPVTIIDRRGVDVYQSAIDEGVMRAALTAEEITSSLKDNWMPAATGERFIETDFGLIHSAIDALDIQDRL